MSILAGVSPERVFYYFEKISEFPRASSNEEAVARYIESTALSFGCKAFRDEKNNVFVEKAASAGCESAPTVLLQGHTDMVCEKNEGTIHDFEKDPIRLKLEGDIISADGTTLGADDGVAVAMMLAVLEDDSLRHGPLECLFTVEEETGLGGMKAFDKSVINAKYMINLDSEDSSCATVSCAGGVRTDFTFSDIPLERCKNEVTLSVTGLAGGHSGADIHTGRMNAVKLTFELLSRVEDVKLISVNGGSKDNAIPRECTAVFTCADPIDAIEAIGECADEIREKLSEADLGLHVDCTYKRGDFHCFAEKYSRSIITLVNSLPTGVLEMSESVEGLVKTSSSLGIIRTDGASVSVTSSSRSSSDHSLDMLLENLGSIAEFACVSSVTSRDRYPGWDVTENSLLQKIYRETYTELYKSEPAIVGIHAGLECGLIKKALPELDIISIGPDAIDIHTPDEKLTVSSTKKVYDLLLAILSKLAD